MISIDFHGLAVNIIGPQQVLDALDDRFYLFPPSERAAPDITFEFLEVTELDLSAISAGVRRQFYRPEKGEALYDPAADRCYLRSDEGISAVCSPAAGFCRVSALQPIKSKLWTLTHPFVTLPLMEMLKRAGRYTIHAASVARNGRSILICGTSGAGKTTLAVTLVRAGFQFMGDDLTVLKANPNIKTLAFPEVIDITERSVSFFSELLPLTAQVKPQGWVKQRLRINDYYAAEIAWDTTPVAILFPQIAETAQSWLLPLTSTDALLELSASVLLTEKNATGAHLKILGELTQSVPSYRFMIGNDFDELPHLVESLTQNL